ncbi:MAG: hypothetical protein ACFFDW_02995 [Candidatus Thorarchaeota archaeon]
MKNNKQYSSLILLIIIITSSANFEFSGINNLDDGLQIDEINNNISPSSFDSHISTNYSENSLQSNGSTDACFQDTNILNQKNDSFVIQNCQDWDISSNFDFTNIRAEKIVNGNAETDDSLWTEYLPPNYEENVSRTNSPQYGEVISDNYSWYFDISTQDTTTIVGFDDPLTLSSHSVIFSFSYSLLYNSLGLTKYSNICIRLFFQFDIYIFIWFNGNPSTLSNVTGPGGYADLLINEANFDSQSYQYNLNITELGLQLFDQEPDELRSFAIQTWGEEPYQMDFMLDDISLTDEISPSTISLKVNNENVIGLPGLGSIYMEYSKVSDIIFEISYNYNNYVYWDCINTYSGRTTCKSSLESMFYNWNFVSLIENFSKSFILPNYVSNFWYEKWIPDDWIIYEIKIDSILIPYDISDNNITHNLVSFNSDYTQNSISMHFLDENKINSISIQNHLINHDEILSFTVDSMLFDEIINYQIIKESEILFENSTRTDYDGEVYIKYSEIQSNFEKANYTILVYWTGENDIGIGLSWFEITSYPTEIECSNIIVVNYGQNLNLNLKYTNLENNLGIEQATIIYNWDFGSGSLISEILGNYSIIISTNSINPGNYSIIITASKLNYATAVFNVSIEIEFSDINLILDTPSYALPGENIKIITRIFDKNLTPLSNINLKYYINDIYFLETQTNLSGISEVYYHVSTGYSESNLNVTSAITFDENEVSSSRNSIIIELLEIYRSVTLAQLNQISASQINNLVSFGFQITYPTIGEKWICDIPQGFIPRRALVMSLEENITANLSLLGKIYWNKNIVTPLSEMDILLLEIPYPNITYSSIELRNQLTINVIIKTNNIPFSNLPILILKETKWLDYMDWALFENNVDISNQYNLRESENGILFELTSSTESEILIFQLKGSKENMINFTPSTIVLGIGITTFTISTSALVFKKKRNVSLDIQI